MGGRRDATADGKGTAYSCTGEGKLETRNWARGTTPTYRYSPCCGALTNIDYGDSTPDVTFAYDRLGRQAAIADGQGVRTFQYDPATLALTNEVLVAAGVTTRLARAQDAYGRPAGLSLITDNPITDYLVSYGYTLTPGGSAASLTVSRAFEPHRNTITALGP